MSSSQENREQRRSARTGVTFASHRTNSKYFFCCFVWDQWSSVTFDRSLLFFFKHTAPSAVESKLQFDLIWFLSPFYLLIKMCPQLLSEEGHVTPTCHHRFIKWLCTIQMKNKIRNTEMEYIARANRCVDSSFLADGSGRLIGALVFYCTYVVGLFFFFFLVCASRISVLHKDIVQSPWWDAAVESLRSFFFFPNVQKNFMTSSGSVIYIYIYIYKNKLKWNITLMTL